MRGALVLCDSQLDTKRVAATLLRRFGSGVEAARDLDGALVALRAGAKAVVWAGTLGAEALPSSAWWPPTIVLGSTFVEADISAVFDRAGREAIAVYSSTEQAELDAELERAFRYLEGLHRPPTAAEAQRDIIGRILRATGAVTAIRRRVPAPRRTPASMEIMAPSRPVVAILRRPLGTSPLALIPALAAAVVIWISVADAVSRPTPIPTTGRPAAFVWGQRLFWGKQEFAVWLRARGTSYDAWARHHPDASKVLERTVSSR
jgi:hypothetical protein